MVCRSDTVMTNNVALLLNLDRPPKSTLFPYTTLFRSGQRQQAAPLLLQRLGPLSLSHLVARWEGDSGPRRCSRDRKSTRLNSSHVEISYAVLCLKKKIGLTSARDQQLGTYSKGMLQRI